ncbi:group II intron reverse transcriptase/maturase [Paenibacillus sp. HB172176]|uniref:group II intron reverse transcriptase/maturase n=1 Tax=Paenibacillus sp. HB172176 TaxID=2493690 RepID=UPI001439EFB6|nr:group II intron reverse transcriptase/maturase [Paenibacillus sp. HB172176]
MKAEGTGRKVHSLIDKVYHRTNLEMAWESVRANGGSGGIDKVSIPAFQAVAEVELERLHEELKQGTYKPMPVRRTRIPKKGKPQEKRPLGIPAIRDRVCQQALKNRLEPIFDTQVLSPIFEPQFAETSYGFRPKRSAHAAWRKCREYANQGYTYVVDMDLEKFFDTVNQSKMIEWLSRTIKDGRVVSLIHKYLQAGAMNKGKFEETELGLVQGGNISPLCSNIMLNELDRELERRGIRFVRYADDMLLFAKTKRSAQRMLDHILPYIEGKLRLKVNREKTVVAYIGKIKFLGYGFYPSKDGIKLHIHAKSVSKMKARIKELTARSNGLGYELLKLQLKQYITGWTNYFKLADRKKLLKRTDQWLRRRLRMYIWKRWKRVRTRYAMLRKFGNNHNTALKFACTRKGYWRIAKSPILSTTVTDARLKQAGYASFSEHFKTVKV